MTFTESYYVKRDKQEKNNLFLRFATYNICILLFNRYFNKNTQIIIFQLDIDIILRSFSCVENTNSLYYNKYLYQEKKLQ